MIFVRSENNDADIFTKNVNTETFNKLAKNIGLKDNMEINAQDEK